MSKTVELKILRQDGPNDPKRWEVFSVPFRPRMNVITCLQDIQKNPVTKNGTTTTPVAWDCNCLEEVCGACTMIINRKPRQSCSALIEKLDQPVELRPLTKFPLVRDLVVDRQRMFDALVHVRAWVPIDGTHDLGPGPRVDPATQERGYSFARCMTCGCCMEACPQYGPGRLFIGPAPLTQVELHGLHPVGAMHQEPRLHALMGPGGLGDCGNAQNCVQVCPKEIPITDAIGDLGRQLTGQFAKDFFGK